MNRLAQFLHYAQKVFGLKTLLRGVRDERPLAQIPTPAVLACLLLGVVLRSSSYLDLSRQTRRRRWRHLCGLNKPLSDDTFEYVTERLSLADLRQSLAGIAKTLKSNKALESCKLNGWLFVSLDANEHFKSRSRCCAGCCQRHIEAPDAKGLLQTIAADEHPRPDTTLDSMARLKPVFRTDGTVHAGNSSGITDGAAAVIVLGGAAATRLGVRPLARIVDYEVCGVAPEIMGIGPVPATRRLLARTGLRLEELDLVELNEAFAAQVLACDRELHMDRDRLNVNGGAIALGHPIGCTGARITVTLLHEMLKRKSHRGVATLCVSGGMGMAMALERAS